MRAMASPPTPTHQVGAGQATPVRVPGSCLSLGMVHVRPPSAVAATPPMGVGGTDGTQSVPTATQERPVRQVRAKPSPMGGAAVESNHGPPLTEARYCPSAGTTSLTAVDDVPMAAHVVARHAAPCRIPVIGARVGALHVAPPSVDTASAPPACPPTLGPCPATAHVSASQDSCPSATTAVGSVPPRTHVAPPSALEADHVPDASWASTTHRRAVRHCTPSTVVAPAGGARTRHRAPPSRVASTSPFPAGPPSPVATQCAASGHETDRSSPGPGGRVWALQRTPPSALWTTTGAPVGSTGPPTRDPTAQQAVVEAHDTARSPAAPGGAGCPTAVGPAGVVPADPEGAEPPPDEHPAARSAVARSTPVVVRCPRVPGRTRGRPMGEAVTGAALYRCAGPPPGWPLRCGEVGRLPFATVGVVDIVLLVAVVTAGVHGLRLGALIQLLTYGGFWVGLTLGALLALVLVPSIHNAAIRTFLTLVLVLGLAVFFGTAGRVLGGWS